MTATSNADSAWDATGSPGYFFEGITGQVLVYDSFYGTNKDVAWVGGACGSDQIWDPPLVLKYNKTFMDGFSASKKKAVAVHEFGHLYGLGHTTHIDCHNQTWHGSMMMGGQVAWDTCSWNTPKVDDVAGVNAIY